MEEAHILERQLKTLRTCHRQIFNLIKLGRLHEAEYQSLVFTGIVRTWGIQKEQREESAVKASNPLAPAFSNK